MSISNEQVESMLGIPGVKVFSVRYVQGFHTFNLEWGSAGQEFPSQAGVLSVEHFPEHTPFSILDEAVRIGEEVMVWIKDEGELKNDGWLEYRRSSLKAQGLPFIIGKEKRKLLGRAIKGSIGVNENMQPYIISQPDGYRFSPSELKAIVRLDVTVKLKEAHVNTPNGTMFYLTKDRYVSLPDGGSLNAKWLPFLKKLIREVGL